MKPSARGSFSGRIFLLLCLAYLLAGILQTYPLVRHLPSHLPYSAQPHSGHEIVGLTQGDHLQLLYHFWLFKDAAEDGRPFFPRTLEFRTGEEATSFSPQFFPLSFGYWILSPLGSAAAYNILVLLSFVLSGLSGYLLCSLFFSPTAAFVGGAVFTLLPFRYGQLMGGHSNGFVSFFAPLALALLIIAFRRRSPVAAFASGLFFLFLCTTDLTAAYFTSFLFFPLLLLLALRREENPPDGGKGEGSSLPPWIGRLPDSPLLPFAAGTAAGLAFHLSVQRALPSPDWFGTGLLSLPWHGFLALLAWNVFTALATRFLPLGRESGRRLASALLLPLFLLLLYPASVSLAIPYGGRILAAAAILLSCALLAAALSTSGVRPGGGKMLPLLSSRASVLLPVVLVALAALSLIYYEKQARISDSSIGAGRSYNEVKIYSPGLESFFSRDLTDAERALYPGLAALLLTAFGLARRRRGEEEEVPGEGWILPFFLWGGLIAALLATGPKGAHISPLFPILRESVPLYDLSRAPSRIFLLTALALSLGSAGGVDALRSWFPDRRLTIAAAVIAILVSADYSPPSIPGLSRLPAESPVYTLAAAAGGGRPLMDVPIWPGDSAWSSLYQYYAMLHGTPTINGYSPMVPGEYFETTFLPLENVNLGEVGPAEHARLSELGVRFLVFHEEAFPPKVSPFPFQLSLDNLLGSPGLDFVERDGPLWLFRLRENPTFEDRPPGTSIMGKVYEAEHYFRHPGKVREDGAAPGGRVVDYPPGEPFSLARPFPVKGKYPAGDYRVRALLPPRGESAGAAVAVQVVSRGGGDILPLPPGGGFTLEEPTPVAFELRSDGEGPITWDALLVTFAGEEGARRTYEAEDLVHMGMSIPDPGDRENGIVQLLPRRDPADYVLLGPDRVHQGGRHRASLHYSTAGAPVFSPGRFEVLLTGTEEPLATAPLDIHTGPREASIDFVLERDVPVRFRVFYEKEGELLLDRITVDLISSD